MKQKSLVSKGTFQHPDLQLESLMQEQPKVPILDSEEPVIIIDDGSGILKGPYTPVVPAANARLDPPPQVPAHETMTERKYHATHSPLTLAHACIASGLLEVGESVDGILRDPLKRRAVFKVWSQIRYEFADALMEGSNQPITKG